MSNTHQKVELKIKFEPKYLDKMKDRPFYAHAEDSGFDIRADLRSDLSLDPGGTFPIPTGLYVAIPSGFEIQVRSRSGLALREDLVVKNSPGSIDCSYRGEIKVILHNLGGQTRRISKGDRIAQLVLAPVVQADFKFVDELDITDRNIDGFGSSGIK